MSVRPKGGLKAQAQRNEVKQDTPETRGQANGAARGAVCKWLSDDFNEVCTNADCDCVADFCPCVNWPQICRHAEPVEDDDDG